MKGKGYIGKILSDDLSARKTETLPFSEKLSEYYIGECGIVAWVIHETAQKR